MGSDRVDIKLWTFGHKPQPLIKTQRYHPRVAPQQPATVGTDVIKAKF